MFYVYQLRRQDQDQPFYIGKGQGNRMYEHLNGQDTNNLLKVNIIEKARREGVQILAEVLIETECEKEAFICETTIIKAFGRRENGTGILSNMTDGGEGVSGYKHTNETRALISAIHKGKPKSETFKKLMSLVHTGRIVSEETRAKLSAALKANDARFTPEYRQKMSDLKKGTKHSQESIEKIKATRIREPRSEETVNRIKETLSKRPILTCPHCGLQTKNAANLSRYHGDKCSALTAHTFL